MFRMLKEIKECPEALARLLQQEMPHIERLGALLREREINAITFVARGTSDNACLYGKYLVESMLGIPAHLAAPSIVTIYGSNIRALHSLVIGVSQSGEGTDVNRYLEHAKATGSMTLAITNTRNSSIAKVADEVIYLHAGREESVAATKTYVTQCMALLMLTAAWAGHKTTLNLLPRLPEAAELVLTQSEPEIMDRVERFRFATQAVVLGRGYHYATAKEMALKLMETCYLPAQAFSIADFLHGPIAMIHEGFPTFLFVTQGRMSAPMMEVAKDLRAKGSESVIFSNTRQTKHYGNVHFMMPRALPEVATPITYIIPGQLFCYHLSITKGLDPDHPKFLQKVTKTL